MPAAVRAPFPRASRLILLLAAACGFALAVFGMSWIDTSPSWAKTIVMIGVATGVVAAGTALLSAENRLLTVLCGLMGGFALFGVNAYLIYQNTQPNPMDTKIEAAHAADPNWDDRALLEVVRDLRSKGFDAVPYLIGRFAIDEDLDPALLPLGGVSTATTVICNEVGEYAVYSSDEYGFNNPMVWPSRADVVVIGDSFAHGACVREEQSVAAQLRARGHSVVSLGVSGYGPMLELATLVEYGLALKPKAVVWMWSDNDYADLVYELTSPLLNRYVEDPNFRQGLVDKQEQVDRHWREYLERHQLLQSKNLQKKDSNPGSDWRGYVDDAIKLRTLRDSLGLTRTDDEAATAAQFVRVMKRAVSQTRAAGGTMYFVDLPHWHESTQSPSEREPGFIAHVGELDGLKLVDFSKVLYDTGDPHAYFPYRLPAHFNAKGYALLAQTLDEAIRR